MSSRRLVRSTFPAFANQAEVDAFFNRLTVAQGIVNALKIRSSCNYRAVIPIVPILDTDDNPILDTDGNPIYPA